MTRPTPEPGAEAEAEAATRPANAPRQQVSQADMPTYSLDEALRVPTAIANEYAAKPTRPIDVAGALDMTPGSTRFRMLAGAALAYGLTTGGAWAPEIGITPLGMRIVQPMIEGDDVAAKREALLKPKIVGDFLRNYDGNPLPSDNIAKNVLRQAGIPANRLDSVFTFIVDAATSVGFVRDIGGKRYVDLAGSPVSPDAGDSVPPDALTGLARQQPPPLVTPPANPVAVSVAPAVYVNIEIHIAADASSSTVEDIFKNMRRYVLSGSGQTDNDLASTS